MTIFEWAACLTCFFFFPELILKWHPELGMDVWGTSNHIFFSYLAETPYACKEKTRTLLEYMLSVEGDNESRCCNRCDPYYVSFIVSLCWWLFPIWRINGWQPLLLRLLFASDVVPNNHRNWRMQAPDIIWRAWNCEFVYNYISTAVKFRIQILTTMQKAVFPLCLSCVDHCYKNVVTL